MNRDFRRYAPLGLILAGLALLTIFILLLVRGLSAASIVTLPDPSLLDRATLIAAALIALGLALTGLLNPDGVREFLTGRQAQYGSNAFVMLLAFLGILIFINLMAFQNPKTWDLTEDKSNTLAPETIKTLQSLPAPVHARAYFSANANKDSAQKLLEKFKTESAGNFSYEFIDPELNKVAAQADNIQRDASIVLLMGEGRELVESVTESELMSGLLRLLNPEARVIYFVTGHGEVDTSASQDPSYFSLKSGLSAKNYSVLPLDLRASGQVPTDASAVVVAGAKKALSPAEMKALQEYLARGGGLLILKEPEALIPFGTATDPLTTLTGQWGIHFADDLIVDPNVQPASFAASDPLAYGSHPITNNLRGVYTYFPTARSLSLDSAPANITLTPLAQTSANAWGETDMASIQNKSVQQNESDLPGPLILAAAAEDSQTSARLVVIGDTELATNSLYASGNADLLMNAIDWAAKKDKLIDLTPKNRVDRQYTPPSTLGLVGIIVVSLCLLPLIVIVGGVSAWLSRRRRG
ncbi:MAG: hypothetical protein OHK0031_04770 [Anaerolineales bacterium]